MTLRTPPRGGVAFFTALYALTTNDLRLSWKHTAVKQGSTHDERAMNTSEAPLHYHRPDRIVQANGEREVSRPPSERRDTSRASRQPRRLLPFPVFELLARQIPRSLAVHRGSNGDSPQCALMDGQRSTKYRREERRSIDPGPDTKDESRSHAISKGGHVMQDAGNGAENEQERNEQPEDDREDLLAKAKKKNKDCSTRPGKRTKG